LGYAKSKRGEGDELVTHKGFQVVTIYKDQLEAVYKLIEKPENWTQEYYARDSAGQPVCDEDGDEIESECSALSAAATCWCIWGAAYKCGIIKRNDSDFVAALGFTDSCEPHTFNDSHTHAEVLALLKSAIERAPVR
jgi:hypothetical protein